MARVFVKAIGLLLEAAAGDRFKVKALRVERSDAILGYNDPAELLAAETSLQEQRKGAQVAELAKILDEIKTEALGVVSASFPAGVKPVVTLTSRVATRNYAVDLSMPGRAGKADAAELQYFLQPTKLVPTNAWHSGESGLLSVSAVIVTASTDRFWIVSV